MDVIVQPADGAEPVLEAIERAKETLDIVIFRFDLKRVEKAIEAAVDRGVAVRALIAHTNAGGEKRLRALEQRMLKAGVTVTRTNDDLVRYQGKLLIVDREELHVYGFNLTAVDLRSRSFGLISRDRRVLNGVERRQSQQRVDGRHPHVSLARHATPRDPHREGRHQRRSECSGHPTSRRSGH